MTTEPSARLPEDVARLIDAGDVEGAGERLLVHGERLARSRPDEARRWAETLNEMRSLDPLFGAFVGWTRGVVFHLVGSPAVAERELTAAAKTLSGIRRPELADRASLLLLDAAAEGLQLDKARRLGRRLQRSFAGRGDDDRAAVAQANLACAEDAADRVERAGQLWRQALPHLDGMRRILVRANLANVAMTAGRFEEAIDGHLRVVEEARSRGLEALAQHGELNLAEAEFAMGRVDAALDRWHRVIEQARSIENRLVELTAEVDLAFAEAEFGEATRARLRVERVLPTLRELGAEPEVARSTRLLVILDAASGARGEWQELSKRLPGGSLRHQRDLLLVDLAQFDPTVDVEELSRAARRLEAAGYRHRASVGVAWTARRLVERGHSKAAARRARELLKRRGISPWARLVAHHALGLTGEKTASRHLFAAVRWADRLHGRLAAAADRSAFLDVRGRVYVDLICLLLERNRPHDRRRALDLLARFRSTWLLDELMAAADDADDPLAQRYRGLRRRLAGLLEGVQGHDEPRLRRSGLRVREAVSDVAAELDEVERSLARRWPRVALNGQPLGVGAGRLLSRLPARHLFLELFVDESDLVTFVACNGRLTARRHAGAGFEVRSLMASTRFHLDAHSAIGELPAGLMVPALRDRLQRLGDLLLEDLPKQGWDTLWIAPHGAMHRLPWWALESHRLGLLTDRALVTLVPGANALTTLLGGCNTRPGSVAIAGASTGKLPMVDREIELLAEVFPGADILAKATRSDFLTALASCDLVHLAGHAVVVEDWPAAAGLKLADGYVTVHDVLTARPSARLVSFGVCSGVRISGADEYRYDGFLRALLASGVRTVVGTVAPVRDEIACRFDLAFYRNLTRIGDPGMAFREAVTTVREIDPNPAVWGNFQLYGDLRPWEES